MILFLTALVACGGGESIHDETSCDQAAWLAKAGISRERCERGCAAGPGGGVDPSGTGVDDTCQSKYDGVTLRSCETKLVATYDGERGCCVPINNDQGSSTFRFFECE